MARTNKYASLNFNDIYEKKATTSTANKHRRSNSLSSSTSLTAPSGNKTILSNSRIHGNMLVLSLPSPKPIVPPPQPSPPPSPAAAAQQPDKPRVEADSISLRPQGRTGSGPSLSPLTSPGGPNKNSPVSPKTNKFVPPHLRPGFLRREEKPGSEFQKQGGSGMRSNLRQGSFGSPNYHGEEGRPKSGGGYERMRRVFEVDPVELHRSRSIGATRPSSSG